MKSDALIAGIFMALVPLFSQAEVKKMTCASFPPESGVNAVTGLLAGGASGIRTLVFNTADFAKESPKLTYTSETHFEYSEEMKQKLPDNDPIVHRVTETIRDFTVSPTHMTVDLSGSYYTQLLTINRSTLEFEIDGKSRPNPCSIEDVVEEKNVF